MKGKKREKEKGRKRGSPASRTSPHFVPGALLRGAEEKAEGYGACTSDAHGPVVAPCIWIAGALTVYTRRG